MERVGFTGTQGGMTNEQYVTVEALLHEIGLQHGIDYATHGGCVGADAQFDALLAEIGVKTVIRPCDIKSKQADINTSGLRHIILCDEREPLDRNTDIVLASTVLIAAPKGYKEERRSGTWSTIRRARTYKIPHWIVWPDGTSERRVSAD